MFAFLMCNYLRRLRVYYNLNTLINVMNSSSNQRTAQETIAAIATAPGYGGIGIVRISGPQAPSIAHILCGQLPKPRFATFCTFYNADHTLIDTGIALYFPAPHSFTGEDVLELQGHGGPVVMDMLLTRVIELGARLARPGEFSERAFLNDKLDLIQAEAIADLITASTTKAAQAALRSLQGAFSKQVQQLAAQLTELRIYIEAAIDFPEEEIDFLADGQIAIRLRALQEQLALLKSNAHQGRLLRDGMTIVIVGRPNAGKSSLLNRLTGRDAAIVTAIPGTTRDLLRENIQIDGMPLHIIDTAGLRDSDDPIEQEGIRRAWQAIEAADRILMVVDDQVGLTPEDDILIEKWPAHIAVTVIHNKIDLTDHLPDIQVTSRGTEIFMSALTGVGFDLLQQHLKDCMGYQVNEGSFMARRRHLQALADTALALERAYQQLTVKSGELVAEELRQAQQALGEMTGTISSDELLGRIFSSFCIGK